MNWREKYPKIIGGWGVGRGETIESGKGLQENWHTFSTEEAPPSEALSGCGGETVREDVSSPDMNDGAD